MPEIYLDACTASGLLEGWARIDGRSGPCQLRILHRGEVVARCVADQFRADLLAAGVGHGHYGFSARLRRPVQPGIQVFDIAPDEPRAGAWRAVSAKIEVPRLSAEAARELSVEDLLAIAPSWTDDEVRNHVEGLGLRTALDHLGPRAFLDRAYLFCFGRRPDEEARQIYGDALARGGIEAGELVRILLASPERKGNAFPLANPHDATYPF